MPDEEVALPVAVTNDDEDGEDVAGPTVEARVELAKTIGAYFYIPNRCQILIYLCSMVSRHQHTDKRHWQTQLLTLLAIFPSQAT